MNEQAREVLVRAAMDGHPQAQGAYHKEDGSDCAIGLLHLTLHRTRYEAMACVDGRCWMAKLRDRFGLDCDETERIFAANDVVGWDFLTIATKFHDPLSELSK